MTIQKYLIWGAKGHAKVLDEIIRCYDGQVIAIFDRDPIQSPLFNLEVMCGKSAYYQWLNTLGDQKISICAAVAIGGGNGRDRYDYYQLFKSDGLLVPALVHPTAWCSASAQLGDGSQICAFGFVGTEAKLGKACIVNTKASVDHETILGNGVHVAPGATICGNVYVDDYTFIGSGATILPNIRIGKNCIVGAGAVVTKDIGDNTAVKGVPAVAY